MINDEKFRYYILKQKSDVYTAMRSFFQKMKARPLLENKASRNAGFFLI